MKKVLLVLILLSCIPAASDTEPGLATSTLPVGYFETVRDRCGDQAGVCNRTIR